MEKIGITIKKIRQIKGLSQKEVYYGIVSRSFASRFEKGENDIQSSKLFKILDNLAISPSEFHFINNSFEQSLFNKLLYKINSLYQTHKILELRNWIEKNSSSNNPQVKLAIGYAELLANTYSYSSIALTKNIYYFVNHLLEQKNWTLQEIKISSMLIPIIVRYPQFDTNVESITKKVENNCKQYTINNTDPFNVYVDLLTYYGVVLQTYLTMKDYGKAKAFKSKFVNLSGKVLSWDGEVSRQLWLSVWELYFGNYQLAVNNLNKILELENIFPKNFDPNIKIIVSVRLKDSRRFRDSSELD